MEINLKHRFLVTHDERHYPFAGFDSIVYTNDCMANCINFARLKIKNVCETMHTDHFIQMYDQEKRKLFKFENERGIYVDV